MKRLINRMKCLATREEGATMVEYGLVIALVAIACWVAVGAFGISVLSLFESVPGGFAPPST